MIWAMASWTYRHTVLSESEVPHIQEVLSNFYIVGTLKKWSRRQETEFITDNCYFPRDIV